MPADPIASIQRVSLSHRRITTAITIEAPPGAVWAVLTDWSALPEWSPSIQGVEGEVGDGKDVVVDYRFRGSVNKLDHRLIYREGEALGWSDPFLPGVRDNHLFRVEALPDGHTRFHQTDEVKGGLLSVLVGWLFARWFKESYVDFNQKLKERVEATARHGA